MTMTNNNPLKCLIWDLDCTIWDGILSEGDDVKLRAEARNLIITLDQRGILNSIVSRNDYQKAKEKLESFGLWEYFVCPQIGWEDKHLNVHEIIQQLNLAPNAFGYIDDQPFERDLVHHHFPEIRIFNENQLQEIELAEYAKPKFITNETNKRRAYYQIEQKRKKYEKEFHKDQMEFLKALDLKCHISPATIDDLKRAEELTIRTHQLNSTGFTYSYDDLLALIHSSHHELYVAKLSDKFGDYGTIGLLLLEKSHKTLNLKLLIVSCRVLSRNVGQVLMQFAIKRAQDEHLQLMADFIENDFNRKMYISYKFAGFDELKRNGNHILLQYEGPVVSNYPDYIDVLENG